MSAKPTIGEYADPSADRVRRVDARRNLEAIIEASIPLLTERPRASMQQIASAAGLHRATVHRHFPSRDDLLDELRHRAITASVVQLEAVMAEPSENAGDTLERATAALIGVGDHFRLYRFTTWRSDVSEESATIVGEHLMSLLAAAQAEGQIREDLPLEQLGIALGGLIVAMMPPVGDGSLTAAQAARTVRMLLAAPGCGC